MKSRINVITLATADLERALVFYRDGLGLPSKGIVGTEYTDEVTGAAGAIAMFELDDGLIFTLYPRSELAKDANVPSTPPSSVEFSLGHMVGSRAEVDAFLAKAEAAGGVIAAKPHERPWGIYSGYLRDLDGHLWEIIWNPDFAYSSEVRFPDRRSRSVGQPRDPKPRIRTSGACDPWGNVSNAASRRSRTN